MRLALVEILLDSLGFAHEVRGVRVGGLDKLFQCLQGLFEFLREFEVLLVLPGIPQGGKPRLQRGHAILKIRVEPLQFFGEPSNFFRVHDCLGHIRFFPLMFLRCHDTIASDRQRVLRLRLNLPCFLSLGKPLNSLLGADSACRSGSVFWITSKNVKRTLFALTFVTLASLSARAQLMRSNLTPGEVQQVIAQAATRASQISSNSVIAVTDREGYVLGVWSVNGMTPATSAFNDLVADAIAKAG